MVGWPTRSPCTSPSSTRGRKPSPAPARMSRCASRPVRRSASSASSCSPLSACPTGTCTSVMPSCRDDGAGRGAAAAPRRSAHRRQRTAARVGRAAGAARPGRPGLGCGAPPRPGEHAIGRGPDAVVRLDDPDVSRRHALLVISTGSRAGTTVRDLGSTNGSRVDGVAVGPEGVPLLPGTGARRRAEPPRAGAAGVGPCHGPARRRRSSLRQPATAPHGTPGARPVHPTRASDTTRAASAAAGRRPRPARGRCRPVRGDSLTDLPRVRPAVTADGAGQLPQRHVGRPSVGPGTTPAPRRRGGPAGVAGRRRPGRGSRCPSSRAPRSGPADARRARPATRTLGAPRRRPRRPAPAGRAGHGDDPTSRCRHRGRAATRKRWSDRELAAAPVTVDLRPQGSSASADLGRGRWP